MESFSDDVLHGETMRPITTGQNAVNIQYAVLHVAFHVNVDSDLQEQ